MSRRRHIKYNNKTNYIMMVISLTLALFIGLFFKLVFDKQADESAKIKVISDQIYKEEVAENKRTQAIKDSLPRIVCWGDSLTAGLGGNGTTYPSVLSRLIKLDVKNYGIGGDSAVQIAERQGALPIYVKEVTIPSNNVAVEISLEDEQGNNIEPMIQGNESINPCSINGIIGNINYDNDKNKYYFSRIRDGEQTLIKGNTILITNGMQDKKDSDILVIFSGTNNHPTVDTIDEVIEVQRKMIEYANTDKYVIIGLTSKDYVPEVEKVNKILQNEYGDKFLDIREYLLQNGLKDAEITPTQQDKTDLENGEIPISLRFDNVHGNSSFYSIIGNQLYLKIINLGYLTSDQLEVLGINDSQ